jgi:O-antigen/teichoic acid export membrane protein
VTASAVPLVLLAALPALRHFLFPSITPGLLVLALLPLPFLMLADSLSSLLLARRRERTYGAMLWARSAGAAVVLATSLFAGGGGRLVWLLAGRIGVSILAVAGLAVILDLRATFRGVASFGRTAVRFAAPVAASGALVSLHRRADVLLLSTLGRASEIGAYAVAYTFAEAFWIVTDSLEAALFVDLARLEPREALARTRRAALLFGAIAAAGVVGLFGGLLLIRAGFGGAYARAGALFPWVLVGALLWGASRPFSAFLYSRRLGSTVLALHAAGLALNVFLCLRWIPSQGALGAAQATLASYSLVTAALVGATAWHGVSGDTPSRTQRQPEVSS